MFDAPMGYHQLAVAVNSQEKLTFQGMDAIKWTYTVMPFGLTNGPATFINFIYVVNSIWKELAKKYGLTIDNDTNNCIIVDNIVSWAGSFKRSLTYMQCQLIVCCTYILSLKLGKSRFFPHPFEFVGIDVCLDGNRPAKSKHQLLKTWPALALVRDVAKFLGFGQFYSRFIPNFKICVAALRGITKQKYTDAGGRHWTPEAKGAWEDLKGAILSNPCIQCIHHCKLIVLRTNFSSLGFGFVLLQPGNNEALAKAAKDYLDGKGFSFMTKGSAAVLHLVCFGTCCTCKNEVWLHSHLGEGFSGDYTINKCCAYVFDQRFV